MPPYDHTILPELAFSNLPTPPAPAEDRELILTVLSEHRRANNCRACTACTWAPAHAGATSDPAATRARHADFNLHLADLISDALTRKEASA